MVDVNLQEGSFSHPAAAKHIRLLVCFIKAVGLLEVLHDLHKKNP